GTSPIWVDGCTVAAGPDFVFEACALPSGTVGTTANNEGGGSGATHPPPSSFTLTAGADPTWGGIVVSSPPGISIDECGGGANPLSARFPTGTLVTLLATPCGVPVQTYDFSWTGACVGTGTTVSVGVSSDVTCRLHLTPH